LLANRHDIPSRSDGVAMAAVLVVLRAGLVSLAAALLLGAAILIPFGLLRLAPPGGTREALIDLVMLGTVVLVLTRGMKWVSAVPLDVLFRPVAAAARGGGVAAAFRIGLAFKAVQWVLSPLVQGQAPEFTALPGPLEVVGTVASATMEEALFRGYLLGVLFRLGRPWAAVLAPSALFAALHLPNIAFCDGTLLELPTLVPLLDWGVSSMVYATMTVLSGRVWPAVALHTLHNLLVMAAGGGGCD
jgi:membrane protease YdiL (CAAX protease family)